MDIRILLADDHQIMRDGLKGVLEKQSDMKVVGEAEDGRAAVRLARELRPHVVIMDIAMPGLNGVEATRQITGEVDGVRVVALSMQSDGPVVRRMFQSGAAAYLLKDCASAELVKAVRAVLQGRTYLSEGIAGVVVKQMTSPAPAGAAGGSLTPKEREVLQLLAEGKTTKEIAAALFLSPKTVDTHRQHIMEKLDLHSIAELTKYAVREGITPLEK
jgi:DNA-binding NarL/FixJ family response regulator